MRKENLVSAGAFAPLAGDPFIAATIRQVKSNKLNALNGMPDNSMPVLDATYKALEDQISRAVRTGSNNRVRRLNQKLEDLRAVMDDAFPD